MMKKITATCMAMVISIMSFAQEIVFTDASNWNTVIELAKKSNKYIFVDCFATWCGPCKQMEKEVYIDPAVGSYVNEHFISVKLQMDKTEKDNELVKSWYADATQFEHKYAIDAYPTLMFFSPNGELAYRNVGFHNVESFTKICKIAVDPVNNYAGQIIQFKKGTLKGEALLKLAMTAKRNKQDTLALEIAKRYRQIVLDKKNPAQLLTPELLPVLGEFSQIYQVKDKLVQYVYHHPDEADKGFGTKGQGLSLVDFYITRDILTPKIKASTKVPDWAALEKLVGRQYDQATAKRTVLPAKANWYYKEKDWETFIKCWIDKIETNGIDLTNGWGGMEINNTIYEIVFKHISDPYVLKKSIEYMESLLKTDPNSHARLDTYASVLYKSGEKEKALEAEQRALEIARKENDSTSADLYTEMIAKMKEGKPTWE